VSRAGEAGGPVADSDDQISTIDAPISELERRGGGLASTREMDGGLTCSAAALGDTGGARLGVVDGERKGRGGLGQSKAKA
jgi:hypothetical protein